MAERALKWLGWILFGAALLLLVGHLLIYVHYAIGLMRFPFDYDQGEGFELVDTVMFSESHWPYRHNEVYPFYASNYPPLFHVILVPFVWVFGPGYWYGRLAGFVGTLITAVTIGYIVQREGRHRLLAVISGLAFLASNYVYHVGPLFRQHMLMVMFETLAVAVLAHVLTVEDTRRRHRIMALGIGLLLAAGYTKQLAVGTVGAVFGFLFLRNPRRSIMWGAFAALIAGGIFLAIDVSTNGAWWDNIIAANVNEYYPSQFIDLFKQWWGLHYVLVTLAGLFVLYELYFDRLSLYSVWWVAGLGLTVLSGKWGAGDSYFATVIAASCVLSGIMAARMVRGAWAFPSNYLTRPFERWRTIFDQQREWVLAVSGIVIPALYIVYGLSVVKMPTEGVVFGDLSEALGYESSYGDRYAFYDAAGWVQGYATIGHVPTQTDIDNGWYIVDAVREGDRPALSEEAAFSLRADKDVVTNPTQLKNLYENDMFDPANLIGAIRAHDFNVVIFRAQFYPPPVVDAVYEAYYPAEKVVMNGFNYEIWRPGPALEMRTAVAAILAPDMADDLENQSIDLSFEQAGAWLTHTLTYHNWVADQALAPDGECATGTYTREAQRVGVELCPGSTVTLHME